ncbi:MAG: hypothetical protein JWM34_2155 [Ilumatobacteraceae bacterium]|nr:hypothetical protein [Ilumatobacteraceae bacterium]
MRDFMGRDSGSDRPSAIQYKDNDPHFEATTAAGTAATTAATIRRRETLMAAIRLSRAVGAAELDQPGAVVDLVRVVAVGNELYDIETSLHPGVFAAGVHEATARVRVGTTDITGTFRIAVGPLDDTDGDVASAPAEWHAADRTTGHPVPINPAIAAQLPESVTVPALTPATLSGAVRRVHLAAERARRELIDTNRGLILSVVNRYRAVVRAESSTLDMSDLIIVGEHQLLSVVDRHFSDPASMPVRDVAWSKLVQRAVGNAVRSEIARATGVSVEFRQLLTWFQAHPEDRTETSAVVAQRMAFAAGVTRLMAAREIHDRFAGVAALELMLVADEARYVAPGKQAAETARQLKAEGYFVISSRSSLAEIERAQQFSSGSNVRLDADPDGHDRQTHLAVSDGGYDTTDATDMVRRIIEDSGMTKVEALVWLHRTGALDPGGFGTELPEIAEDLGLNGRSEARAALRRARRKLDAWSATGATLALVS